MMDIGRSHVLTHEALEVGRMAVGLGRGLRISETSIGTQAPLGHGSHRFAQVREDGDVAPNLGGYWWVSRGRNTARKSSVERPPVLVPFCVGVVGRRQTSHWHTRRSFFFPFHSIPGDFFGRLTH